MGIPGWSLVLSMARRKRIPVSSSLIQACAFYHLIYVESVDADGRYRKTRPKVRRAAEEAAVSSNALAPADTSKRLKSSETNASESSSSSSSCSSNAPPPPLQRRSSRHRQRASWWSRNFKSEPAASDLADHHALLGVYRVSIHKLSRKSEYQILHVDNRSPALTPQQRLARRIPASQRA